MKNGLIQLGNAFEFIRNGKSIKQKGNKGVPITRIETIAKGSVDINKMGYADISSIAGFEKYKLEVGDILMSHINSEKHLGKVALFQEIVPVIHGMNLLCLRAKKSLNSKFALYFFRTNLFMGQLSKITKKSVNQASFNVGSLKLLKIPLPPLETQKQIVDLLDRAQALIDKRKEQIVLMDQLLQSLFYDMFGDPVTNPMGWPTSTLGAISEVKTGSTPSRKIDNYWNVENHYWVKTNEVNGTVIDTTDEMISDLALEKTSVSILPANTILIAMYGQGKTRGRVGILGIEATTNQACAALLPSQKINTSYLFNYLKMSYQVLRNLGRGGNQPNLNLSLVREFSIFLPPVNIQNTYADRVQKIEAQKEAMTVSLKELEDNFNSIMQRAFKGEL